MSFFFDLDTQRPFRKGYTFSPPDFPEEDLRRLKALVGTKEVAST